MTCVGYEAHAREALEAIPGVASAAVSYRSSGAEVAWHAEPDDTAVADAIAELEYRVSRLR